MLRFAARLAIIALAVSPMPFARASAQDRVSIGTSVAFVSGSTNPSLARQIGYQTSVNLEYQTFIQQLRLRSDLFRADWGSSQVTGLTANAVIAPFTVRALAPYVAVGGGLYQSNGTSAGLGLSVGTTFPFGARRAYLESGFHNYDAHTNWLGSQPIDAATARQLGIQNSRRNLFVPLTFGIRF